MIGKLFLKMSLHLKNHKGGEVGWDEKNINKYRHRYPFLKEMVSHNTYHLSHFLLHVTIYPELSPQVYEEIPLASLTAHSPPLCGCSELIQPFLSIDKHLASFQLSEDNLLNRRNK